MSEHYKTNEPSVFFEELLKSNGNELTVFEDNIMPYVATKRGDMIVWESKYWNAFLEYLRSKGFKLTYPEKKNHKCQRKET